MTRKLVAWWGGFQTAFYPVAPPKAGGWGEIFATPADVEVFPFVTGWCRGDRAAFTNKKHPLAHTLTGVFEDPVLAYLVRHKTFGDILIDTGFHGSFHHDPSGNLSPMAKIFQRLVKIKNVQHEGEGLSCHLQASDAHPKTVFFTHLHMDHTSGIEALGPGVEYVVCQDELSPMGVFSCLNHLKAAGKIQTIDISRGGPLEPFSKVADLLGDQSLFAVATPGHSAGHLSFVVNAKAGPVLITGDACFFYAALEKGIEPFAVDPKAATQSIQELGQFAEAFPDATVYVGHDKPKGL